MSENTKAALKVPPEFIEAAKSVHLYLDRAFTYSWKTLENKNEIPLGVTCVITCKGKGWEARCLAFAALEGSKICWFGVTAAWHAPEELYGVVGYVPLADVMELFV